MTASRRPARRLELMTFDELHPADRNPKRHDTDGLAASIAHHGVVELITLDERTGRIVAGHGRLDTLAAAHAANPHEPPDGVELDEGGAWRIPVVRGWHSRDDADAEAYLVYSNRSTEQGGWDTGELLTMLDGLDDAGLLELAGFTHGERDDLAALAALDTKPLEPSLPRPGRDVDPDAGAAPAPAENPITQPGDVWQLGPHRLLCADSLVDTGAVDAFLGGAGVHLVLEDPPYAIYGSSTGIGADIADDKMVRPFFEAVLSQARRISAEFGHVLVHCDWRSYSALWEAARRAGLTPKNCIVWDKGGSGLGSNYANAHEFVAFFAKMPPPRAMAANAKRGQRSVHAPNVMRHNRPSGAERLHNAAKPVAMLEDLITNSTDAGDRVFDGFAGSGSTLIAAHRAGRTCFAVEVNPGWCDVIAKRYEDYTGEAPILTGTGPVTFGDGE